MVGKLTSDAKLSASLAPVLMNQSHPTYGMSQNDLMARVLNAQGRGDFNVSEYSGSEAADHGNNLEGYIITEAAKRLGIDKFNKDVTNVYDYDDLFSASLDAIFYNKKMAIEASDNIFLMNGADAMILEGDGICESKLTSASFSEVPKPYRGPWQVQMQMLCHGAKWAVVATFYQGTRLVLNIYEADLDMQNQLIEAAKDFYERLDGPDWYPAMNGPDAARTWERGEDHLPSVDLEPVAELALQYLDAKRASKAAEELAKKLEPQIMTHMANHEMAHLKDENGEVMLELKWPTRNFKPQPEKVIPAKPARVERQKSLSIPAKWMNQ